MSIYIDNLDDMEDMDEECPLCMEPLEIDDLNFYPCTCGYQICRFCWHRIRTDENGLCPACRKAYSENPADFKPLSNEELQKIKRERKATEASRRLKLTESRKHLASVRVVQKNLVFVVGLGPRLADTEVLRKNEYFGKFGKIHKVVVNHTTTYAGSQGPSASAYITYFKEDDSLRAIQAVNNLHVDGRTLKASLGTTKYCSSFLNSPQCPKPVTCPRADCMYLHELGDEEASFTKEEMQLGRHTEFEQRLHEALNRAEAAQTATISTSSCASASTPTLSSSGFPSSAPVCAIPPVCAETPIPLMASSAGSSASSSLGNPSSSTIVSLMGLDLSKTITARKKSSQSPPPPPPSLTSLMMDSRGVIKPSNKTDAPPGMEWPALGGSRGSGTLGESDYPPLSREHSTSMDFGLAFDSSAAASSSTIITTTTSSILSSEVLSFSTVVNGETTSSDAGGGEAGRWRGDAKEGDGEGLRGSYTARTMTMMEIGAGDGLDADNASDLVEVAAEEAAIAAATALGTTTAASISKKAKKKARKDGAGNAVEDAGAAAAASGQEAAKKAAAGTNNNNNNSNKKQQQQFKDSNEKNGKGNNNSAKAQNAKGDNNNKASKKKSKDETSSKKNNNNSGGKDGGGNNKNGENNSTKEKSTSSEASSKASSAAVGADGDAAAKKSNNKQITSLETGVSSNGSLPVGMDASHLPPSPSPSPPISSTPSSSQSSSLSSTPSSSGCNSLWTAASKDPRKTTVDVPSTTNVDMSVAVNNPEGFSGILGNDGGIEDSSSNTAASLVLPTPTASPESSVGSRDLTLPSLPFPTHDSYSSIAPSLSVAFNKNSSSALPIRLEQDPNSSFFSNEFTRIRFVPPETSDAVGVARLGQDVDPSDNGASNGKITAQSQETDWSAAFGFNSAKETAKGAMDAEDGPFLDEDEDLGFDPFCESQRGLQDLLRGESNPGDVPDTGYSYGRSMSALFPTPSDGYLPKPPSQSSHFPPQPRLLPSQSKPHLYQQHPPPPIKSQTSLLDGLIQQHHEEDLLPSSLDLSKKSTSAHPPGFFSSSQQTSSRFFGPTGSMISSTTSSSSSTNHALGNTANHALGNTANHVVVGNPDSNQKSESFLRSLMFDNNHASSSSSAAATGLRTTPPTAIPPPPPGMGLPQHHHHQQQHHQQQLQQKPMPPLSFAANASQRLPPGFSTDNLTRQNSNPNAIDDFLGRSGWSKTQPQNRSQLSNPLDNPTAAHLQQQQQQQQPQNHSRMMGLMNLDKAGKMDDFDHMTSFSSASMAPTLSTSSGIDPLLRGGLPFGSSNQSALSSSSSSTSVKDWQEGFRALLPNVNISFSQNANLNNGGSSGSSAFPGNLPPWDDPAIVTAANASKHFNNINNNSPLRNSHELRGNQEEQPHWMKSLQQLTEMTDSAPPKRAQGSSPSAFLPTLAGINQSSLLGSPFGSHNVQQQQSQQQQQLMQSAMLGNRSQSDRVYQMGGDWGPSYSGGFSGPSLTSAPPGFRLPNATSGQPAPTGATN